MSTVATDRRQGVNSGAAVKVPCRVATTASITLSGLQTIDGVALAAGDRVLVKDQSTASQNGIYEADTSSWNRALDFDGRFDVKKGTWVRVNEGAVHANEWFCVSTSDPITVGTSSLTFTSAALLTQILTQLGDASNSIYGDALVAVKTLLSDAIAQTLHEWINKRIVSLGDGTAVGDGTTNDRVGIQTAIDDVSSAGSGTVMAERGKVYKVITGTSLHSCTVGVVGKENVTLDLQGSELHIYASAGGNQIGLWVYGDNFRVINGAVKFFINGFSGSISSQGSFGCAIFVGAFNNIGDTVASPNPAQYISGWSIGQEHAPVTVHTDCPGRPAVQIAGGVHHGYVNVFIPTSSTCGGVHGDWGNVGLVSSSADPARITETRATYDADLMYVNHPHDIVVKFKAGKLTHVNAHATRWSACYNITVSGFVEEVGYCAGFYTAGDLGKEFTRDGRAAFGNVNELDLVNKGIDIHVNALKCNYIGFYGDSLGDNIKGAVGSGPYAAARDPYYDCDVTFTGRLVGKGSAGVGVGLLAQDTRGGIKFVDCCVTGFLLGGYADYLTAYTDGVTRGARWIRCKSYANLQDGFAFRDFAGQADNWWEDCDSYLNGTSGSGYSGYRAYGGERPNALRCRAGDSTAVDATQTYGLRFDQACTDATVEGNFVHSVKAGGLAYAIGNSTDYALLRLFRGNNTAAYMKAVERYSGVNLLPESATFDPATGLLIRTFRATTAAAPSAGTFTRGDRIIYPPTAATAEGTECVTSGTFSAATDGTGDTDGSSGLVAGMADTSDFFVGEWVTCSAGFASTGPFRVLAKTSTSITVDATSNSSQSNITVATPDPVFKAMAALAA